MADGGEAPGVVGGYRAFLSYSHKDAVWGARLHRRLEGYRLPKRLAGSETARGVVPERLSPVFRDREELSAGENLSDTIKAALAASDNLIVLCSPNAKASPWVAKEIALFRELHPGHPVLAALIAGEPAEAFPEALLRFPSPLWGEGQGVGPARVGEPKRTGAAKLGAGNIAPQTRRAPLPVSLSPEGRGEAAEAAGELLEPIAADFRKSGDGERLALLKLAAGMTGVPLDALVQRDAQRQMRRVTAITGAALAAVLVMALLTTFAFRAQAEAERQRAEAEGLVEYMLTDLRDRLKGVGRLDVMTAVNERAMKYYGVGTPEGQLLKARILHAMGEDDQSRRDLSAAERRFAEAEILTKNVLRKNPKLTSAIFAHAQSKYWVGHAAYLKSNRRKAIDNWSQYKTLADSLRKAEPKRENWIREVGYAEGALCAVALEQPPDPSQALKWCSAAMRTIDSLVRLRPNDRQAQVDRANRLAWLADAWRSNQKSENAISAREEQLAILRIVQRDDPVNAGYQELLMKAYIATAETYESICNFQIASKYREEALDMADNLITKDPSNVNWSKFRARTLKYRENIRRICNNV